MLIPSKHSQHERKMTTISNLTTSTNSNNNAGNLNTKATSTSKSTSKSSTEESSALNKKSLNPADTKVKKNYGFTLTTDQQKKLASILEKYKDKPQTQENYDKIQAELKPLKLDTATLSIKDNAKNFSVRKMVLSLVNGKSAERSEENKKAQDIKKSAYAKQIVSDWKDISTNNKPLSLLV